MSGKISGLLTIVVVIAAIIEACDYGENIYLPGTPQLPELITQSGGVIHGLNGDVTLVIPAEALDEPVTFTISAVEPEEGSGLLIKPIVIEPLVQFKIEAELEIKFTGQLALDEGISEEMPLEPISWGSIDQMCDGQSCCPSNEACRNCCVNMASGTVKMLAPHTGVFSVRLKGN